MIGIKEDLRFIRLMKLNFESWHTLDMIYILMNIKDLKIFFRLMESIQRRTVLTPFSYNKSFQQMNYKEA